MKRFLSLILSAALIFGTIANITFTTTASAADEGTVVRLDPSNASPFNNGEFQGWGTSMGWWANRLGYSESLTQQAADAFFSEEGLGLDIARYNLGGGDDPTHNHINRSDSKVPTYAVPTLDEDGKPSKDAEGNYIWTYDWTADENQRNIALAAKAANADLYFEGFSNSPPWFMTNSGCSSGATNAGDDNLSSEHFDEFGKFIADVTAHFKESFGITFQSYSPMNEPDTTYWGAMSPKQEGAHYSPGATQSGTIIATRNALDEAGLTDVLVAGMDETSLKSTYNNLWSLTPEARTALGRIDTHTYSDRGYHARVKERAVEFGKNLWMSEVDAGGNGFTLASMIIEDMNGMQPSAWVMWDIVDFHKDSNFVDPTTGNKTEANNSVTDTSSLWGVGMADHDNEKLILTNKYYAYGQFTKYINPGDTIIASSSNTLAAYNKKSGEIKIVALNSGSSDRPYTFDLGAFTNVGDTVKEIRTNNGTGSSAERWANITDEATLTGKKLSTTLKAGTITTYIISGASAQGTNYISVNGADRVSLGDSAKYTYDTDIALDLAPTYSVSDNTIAEIDASGNLTAKKKGAVTVTAAIGEASGSKDVEIYFDITGSGDKIKLGSEVQLSAGTNLTGVTWSSSDTDVLTVTETGLVKAVTAGEATITATHGTDTATRTFTVPSYVLSGTPSWGNASNAPKDSDDYTQVADGSFSTYFDGTTGGHVQYDFGSPYSVTSVKLAPRSGYASRTVGGEVQGSSDGITWTKLYKIPSALTENTYTTVNAADMTDLKAYRYYRYTNTAGMANISEFLIEGAPAAEAPAGEPVVADIDEFTDDFEGSSNIFDAVQGELSEANRTNIVFASGLARFGKVFAPFKSTAKAELSKPLELTEKQKFRLTFNMFAGWEDTGKNNTFKINDKDGNEIAAIYITGGGYTLQEIRIGGKNVLDTTHVAQSKSNASTSRTGANGWGVSNQPYRNYAGFNKSVEITIDGAGNVSVSLTGGMEDTSVTGLLTAPVTIGSIEANGDFNAAANRTVSYDNFDGDVITYTEAFTVPEPEPEPEPDKPLTIPSNGELIHLNFDGDLTSTSEYGKATAVGTAKFATVDEKQVIQFDGTRATAIKLTDANGNPLLTGQKNLTISFKVKPTVTTTSWWFFAAPNDSTQTYQQEKYLGAHTSGGKLNVERYNNSGSRSAMATAAVTTNEWNEVEIHVNNGTTSVFINGEKQSSVASSVNISDMLGASSVMYLGLANWGTGEFATGYMDDFVIKNYSLPTVSAYRSGDVLGYTSDYSESDGYDMFVAVRDAQKNLIGVGKGATGAVTLPDENGIYTVTEYLWKNMEPVTEPISITPETVSDAYLFAHFVGTESTADMEQIYFSLSTDGTSWKTINSGAPILTSTVGEQGVRDPYIMRTEDGKFVIIATDLSIYNLGKTQGSNKWGYSQTNGSKNIVVWKSDDLVNWSNANLVKVAVDTAGCTWAPEAVYDSEKQQYMVFWASKVSTDSYAKQRMYRSYTTDFETFTEPEVYIDNTKSAIDTTIIKENGVYYRFTKDEDVNSILMEESTSLDIDGWSAVDTYTINGAAGTSVTGYEGPTIYKLNGENKWCLLLDYYSKSQGYKPFVTNDITVGAFTSAADFTFDATYRHGTVLPITGEEYIKLITTY